MSNKTNLWIDLGIFAAFLVAFEPRLTGITIHEWLSLALAAAVVAHLLLHWKWIWQVLVRFFRQLFHASRLKFVVDLLLFIAFNGVMLSGLLISRSVLPALGLETLHGGSWERLHGLFANFSLYLMAVHFALNWKWVVTMVKRYLIAPVVGLLARRSPQPGSEPVLVEVRNSEQSS